jgi:hypothetical protein
MPGRKWGLSVVIGVLLSGLMTSGTRGQGITPVVWQPIEVWGVSGRSFGSIRVGQPSSNGVVRHSLLAEFVPADGRLLSELAAILWPGAKANCLHFNWIQVVLHSGQPPLPVDAAGLPRNPPFLDPPAGGYQGDRKPADALPWFLDETPYIARQTADMNIHNPNITLPTILRWYASPYSADVPDAMQYDTALVLINDCTGQYEPLGGFHWTANFPAQGEPRFDITPFGPREFFAHGALVTAFTEGFRGRQKARLWKIRPLAAPAAVKP